MDEEKVNVLVTGGSGFLGTALIDKLLAKGKRVISISRHPPELRENMVPLVGDITEPNLGLNDGLFDVTSSSQIDSLYHLAAIHRLGKDDGSIWKTNVDGTRNVIRFCVEHKIPHLLFCSSAYTQGWNAYERSKIVGEMMVQESDISQKTIFKPSIVLGTSQHFYPGHFCQFVQLLVSLHQKAEVVRRKIEAGLRLPVLEPVFRIKGNPCGRLNLVTVDAVTEAMASMDKGTYWLTNPKPPTLAELAEWVGEIIQVKIVFERDFKPTPIEMAFHKMTSAFQPYLEGYDFPSHLPDFPPLTQEFIQETILQTLLRWLFDSPPPQS